MKDSTAASSNSPTPAPKARSGKTAAPKAKAQAVAKAKARARVKTSEAKAAVPEDLKPKAATPEIVEAAAPKIAASKATKSEVVKAKVEASGVPKNQEAPSELEVPKAVKMPENKAVSPQLQKDAIAAAKSEKPAEPKAAQAKVTAPQPAKTGASNAAKPANDKPKAQPAAVKAKAAGPVASASKTAPARADAPKADAPKADAPKADAPKANAPKANGSKAAPAKINAPKPAPAQHIAPKSGAAPVAASKASISNDAASRGRSWPKLRASHIVGIVALVGLTGVAGAAVGTYSNWANSQTIAPKVRIAGEPIGGLTRDEAVARLNARFDKLAFTLQTDDKKMVLGLADIGGKPSIEPTVDKAFAIGRGDNLVDNFTRVFGAEVKPRAFMLPIEWNRGALTSRLKIVSDQYEQPATDARLVTVSGGAPRVTGENYGRAIDVSATADAIQKSYFLGKSEIEAVTQPLAPKVRAADLAGRDVKLGEWRTNYNGGIVGRTTNIKVACRAIDGQVFMPGEVLSFNELTGERTYSKGYRMAHIFLREKGQTESQVVDGLAGGVCQVSSTLYNAVRKVNLESAGKPLGIVERNSHSLPVTYVAPGRDATVAWPHKDFKFRNDNNFPIYVRTASGDGRLTISIWGRVPESQALPVSLQN